MSNDIKKKSRKSKRVHLINLFRWRSGLALASCLITLVVSLSAIGYSFVSVTLKEVREMFKWFTIDSNILTALAAVLIIPFAVEGIRKKRLTYPKWVQRIHYSGTACLLLIMIFSIGLISWYDPVIAFGGANFYLHIICPIMITLSFFMVESDYRLSRKDNLFILIPIMIYGMVYYYNVMITGNWSDHYNLNTYTPIYISAILVFIISYAIGLAIRTAYNKLHSYREKKMKQIWEDDELDPVSIRIEIYSLGVHAGLHEEKYDVSIPFDILEDVSVKFGIRLEDLVRAYSKGMIDGLREKEEKTQKTDP